MKTAIQQLNDFYNDNKHLIVTKEYFSKSLKDLGVKGQNLNTKKMYIQEAILFAKDYANQYDNPLDIETISDLREAAQEDFIEGVKYAFKIIIRDLKEIADDERNNIVYRHQIIDIIKKLNIT